MEQVKVTNMIEGVLENRNDHILRNQRLIWSVVQRFMNRGYDPDDLFQIGAMGYMKAFERFDDSYGVKWSTYAVPMIIGEIQRFIRDDGTIKTPRRLKELANKFRHSDCYGLKREQIAEKLELDLSQVDELLYFMKVRQPSSIDQTVYENDGDPLTIADQVGDFDDYSGSFVNDFLRGLEERDAQVVKLVMAGMKQQEIADQIGVSQVQVSRIIKNKVKPLLEQYLGETGQLDKVVKERAPRKSKPVSADPVKVDKPKKVEKPKQKRESVVVMIKINKNKPLNGLTVEIYEAMRKEGKSNGYIQRFFQLHNAAYYGWKKQNGLTDSVRSATISKQRKEEVKKKTAPLYGKTVQSVQAAKEVEKNNDIQGDDVEMMATAVKPENVSSLVNKTDRYIAELEEKVTKYKAEINRLAKLINESKGKHEEALKTVHDAYQVKLNKLYKQIDEVTAKQVNDQDELRKVYEEAYNKGVANSEERINALTEELAQTKNDYSVFYDNAANHSHGQDKKIKELEEAKLLVEAKLEQMDFDFNEIVAERDRYESEAHELNRMWQEELNRANKLEAELKEATAHADAYAEASNIKTDRIQALEVKCFDLEEQNASLVNMRGDLEDNTRQLQNAAFSENNALKEKIKQLEATLKLYL